MSQYHPAALAAHGLRPGMWVRHPSGVGILTGCLPLSADIMLVHPDGSNRLAVAALPWELRQAGFKEIPEPRRPSEGMARKLGYL